MELELKSAALGLAIVSASSWLVSQGEKQPTASCNAPGYFGMCDSFVPGTIIFVSSDGPINVESRG